MADTSTQEEVLNIECYFVDGDTRTVTLKNPLPTASLLTSKFTELNSFIRSNNALVGDRGGATFGRITKATRVHKTKIGFDLETT